MNRLHEFLHSRRVKSGYNPSYSDIVLASVQLRNGRRNALPVPPL